MRRLSPFAFVRLARWTLGWNLVVIVWGAFVRATGSGAGCGAHWPLCDGQLVPRAPRVETLIELSHRLSSGVALILGLWLVWAAFGSFARGHRVRRLAAWSFVLLLGEAAIGAGIVLLEYVAGNDSLARAAWMAAHLVNTYFLLATLALCEPAVNDRVRRAREALGEVGGKLRWVLVGMMVVAATGAIAALGDTLFAVAGTTSAWLRLRIVHPLVAVALVGFAVLVANEARQRVREDSVRSWSQRVVLLALVQVGLGVANVALRAPVWMQLVHLLAADLLWIAAVRLDDRLRFEVGAGSAAQMPVAAVPVHQR